MINQINLKTSSKLGLSTIYLNKCKTYRLMWAQPGLQLERIGTVHWLDRELAEMVPVAAWIPLELVLERKKTLQNTNNSLIAMKMLVKSHHHC